MAYPTGSGSERLMRGTIDSVSNTEACLLFDGNNNTGINQTTNAVPANHIITVLSIIICEMGGASELIRMYVQCVSPSSSIFLLRDQPIGANATFVWNEKIVLQGGDKLAVYLNSAGNCDVNYSYIDQDWS